MEQFRQSVRLYAAAVAIGAIMGCMTVPPTAFEPGSHGLIVPLYVYPDRSPGSKRGYDLVTRTAASDPELAVVVVVNPANGPGADTDAAYARAIRGLLRSGAVVVGYVPLGYGRRSIDEIHRDIARWKRSYTGVTGLFFDEVDAADDRGLWEGGVRARHAAAVNAARVAGYSLLIGNAGRPVHRDLYAPDLFDVVITFENDRWPTPGMASAPRSDLAIRSGALVYGDGVWDDWRYERIADRYGFVYVNDHALDVTGAGAYPWNYVPSNLASQADRLARRDSDAPRR